MDKKIKAYKVRNEDLPKATKEMNGDWSHFKSSVVEIITGDSISTVITEQYGSYPFITNGWDFIVGD